MLTSVRSLLAATILAGSALVATPALAQEEETPAVTVAGSAAFVTDYRFRGIGLSGGDPAVQAGITLNTKPGFYVGAWGSSIDDGGTGVYGEMELDIFAGWTGTLTEGLGADVGVTYYAYPTNDFGPADVWEFYAKLKPTLGPVGFTFGVYYSPDQDSLGGTDNLYLSGDAAFTIPETPVSLTAHVGYTDGFLTFTPDGDAMDYSLGASVTVLGNLSIGVAYVGVDGPTGPAWDGITDDTVVGTLSAAF